jgi:hypothetical protein
MSWACGPGFQFARLARALCDRDWAVAAVECKIREAGNPGVVPRNVANRVMYKNAEQSQAIGMDPSILIYEL